MIFVSIIYVSVDGVDVDVDVFRYFFRVRAYGEFVIVYCVFVREIWDVILLYLGCVGFICDVKSIKCLKVVDDDVSVRVIRVNVRVWIRRVVAVYIYVLCFICFGCGWIVDILLSDVVWGKLCVFFLF